MMAKKQNPLLAAFEAKKEAEFAQRRACLTEINMIAMLIAGSRLGFVGECRSGDLLEEQIKVKTEIATILAEDSEVDQNLTFTKADLARSLKQILGKNWPKYRYLFPLLKDYWED